MSTSLAGEIIWDYPCDATNIHNLNCPTTQLSQSNCATSEFLPNQLTLKGQSNGQAAFASAHHTARKNEVCLQSMLSIQADVSIQPGCSDPNASMNFRALVSDSQNAVELFDSYKIGLTHGFTQAESNWHVDARLADHQSGKRVLKVVRCKDADTETKSYTTEAGNTASVKQCSNFDSQTQDVYLLPEKGTLEFMADYWGGICHCGTSVPSCALNISNFIAIQEYSSGPSPKPTCF